MNRTDRNALLTLPGHDSPIGGPQRILDWLAHGARAYGSAPAILGIDGTGLSHRDLYAHVGRIADGLLQAGIGRGDVVMLVLPNGPHALCAILSVASVAAALPMGIEEPLESIARTLSMLPVKAIVYDPALSPGILGLCSARGPSPLPIRAGFAGEPAGFDLPDLAHGRGTLAARTRIDDAAIVVRTAGTTAQPRLIAGSQASLYRAIDTAADWMGLGPGDRSLCVMPLSHLHSLWRSAGPGLLRGGAVVCAPGFDKVRLFDWIRACKPTYMTAVPGAYRSLLAHAADTGETLGKTSLRFLVTASDSIDRATVESLASLFEAPVRELYGMSEVTPMLAASPPGVNARGDGAVGRPLQDWVIECRDELGRALGIGQEGEIAVRGGLINPVASVGDGGRGRVVDGWYLTGDLGFIDPYGLLHVTARVDDRINRGGKKIAPAAVESALLEHPAVAQAVVFAVPDVLLGQRVAALVVLKSGEGPEPLALRSFVAERLPDFMVPERIDLAESIPHTALGKVARNKLAETLGIAGIETGAPVATRTRAVTHTEAVLQMLLRELLALEEIDLGADFMDLGGDSFLAVALLEAIDARLGIYLSPAQFLANANVIALARLIDDLKGDTEPPLIVAVRPGGDRAPLFITHNPSGYAYYAHAFAEHLGPDQPVYAFQLQTPPPGVPLTMENHAARYVVAMRAIQPQGPYRIMGHSAGAHLAFECAQQLAAAGEPIDFLGVIDDEADLFKRQFGVRTEEDSRTSTFERFRQVLMRYVPRPYPGKVHLFYAEVTLPERLADATMGWGDLALGGVETIEVPGDHITMMSGRQIAQWAPTLLACLTSSPSDAAGRDAWAESCARTEALRERPDQAALVRARELAKAGDLNGEIAEYRQALALSADQPYWVYRNLGAALYQHGDYAEAIEHLRAALEREDTPVMGQIELAQTLHGLGRANEARVEIDRAETLAGDLAHGLYAVGRAWRTLGDPASAERCLRRAIELKPIHCLAREQSSDALIELGRGKEAVSMALSVLDLRPDRDAQVCARARRLAAHGDPGNARSLLEGLIARRPRHAAAHLQLSQLHKQQGELQEAAALAKRALELGADPLQCRIHLGQLCLQQGQHASALPWLREAQGLAPGNVSVLHHLGVALEGTDRIDDALSLARQAAALAPERGDLAARVGVLLWRQGDAESAETHLRRALDLGHRRPGVCRMLSQIALRTGRLRLALELAEQALDLAPEDAALREHLDRVRHRFAPDRP